MGISYDAWRNLPGIKDDPERLALHPDNPARASQFRGGAKGCHRITIPFWRPATVNELMTSVRRRIQRKRADRLIVGHYGRETPSARGPRRVHLAITMKRGFKRPDADALWKSLLDALVYHGLLIDDDTGHCVLDPVEFVAGDTPETTIELTDL